MNEPRPIELILPATQPLTEDKIKGLSDKLGADHKFLLEPEEWSAVVRSDQANMTNRYNVQIDWRGERKIVPAEIVAVNRSGGRSKLFGGPEVVDQSEREMAVVVNTDFLPDSHLFEGKLPNGFEPNLSGHSLTVYTSSVNLVNKTSVAGLGERKG